MTLIQSGLTIKPAAESLDEGSNVFFFERVNTEENPLSFVTTPATNIPWILPVCFDNVRDVSQDLKHVNRTSLAVLTFLIFKCQTR